MKGKPPLRQLAWAVAGIILLLLFAFVLDAPASMEIAAAEKGVSGKTAMGVLGVILWALVWWAGQLFPNWIIGLGMLSLLVLAGYFPFSTAFASFSGTSFWMIFGAFGLAAGAKKTGLLQRISIGLMRLFPPTYWGQMIALVIAGTICSPLIPSTSAKFVMGAVVAKGTADIMGYGSESNGRYGLFLAAWTGFSLSAPAFKSSGVNSFTMFVSLPAEVQPEVSWTSWLIASLPWLLIMLLGMLLALRFSYQPSEKSGMTHAQAEERYRALGPIGTEEGQTIVILGGCLLCWVFEGVLGLNSAVVAIVATLLLFALKILTPSDLANSIPWPLLFFVGVVSGISTLLSRVGIDIWLKEELTPLFSLLKSPVLLVFIVTITVVLARFFLVSYVVTISLFVAILSPVFIEIGIHPLIAGIVVDVATSMWLMPYQSVSYIAGFACMEDTITYSKAAKASVVYQFISLLACCISIPYWSMLGYL